MFTDIIVCVLILAGIAMVFDAVTHGGLPPDGNE